MRRRTLPSILLNALLLTVGVDVAWSEPEIVLAGRLLVEGEPVRGWTGAPPHIDVRRPATGDPIPGAETAFDASEGMFRIEGLRSRERLWIDVRFDDRYSASPEIDLSLRNGPTDGAIAYWEDISLWVRMELRSPARLGGSDDPATGDDPLLDSPLDFEWDSVQPGARYRLVIREVGRDSGTTDVIIDKVLATPFFHTPLTPSPDGSHYEIEIEAQDVKSQVVGRLVADGELRSPSRFRVR